MNTLMALFTAATVQFNLPHGLLASLCYVESNHNVHAYHANDGKGNSVGVCQIKLAVAQDYGFEGTEEQLMRPDVNIYYAAAHLNHQLKRYNNVERAVIAYNMGHAGTLLYSEYQMKVFKQWRGE